MGQPHTITFSLLVYIFFASIVLEFHLNVIWRTLITEDYKVGVTSAINFSKTPIQSGRVLIISGDSVCRLFAFAGLTTTAS
jgi:hypothetical protein